MGGLVPSFRAYRALWIAFCLALGIVGAELGRSLSTGTWASLCGLAALFVVVLLAVPARRMVTLRPLGYTLGLGVLLLGLGAVVHTSRRSLPAGHFAHQLYAASWQHTPTWIEGRVQGGIERGRRLRFTLFLTRLAPQADTLEARGRARVTLYADDQPLPHVAPGDTLRLRALLRPLPPRRNPADFDYGRYLRRRGVHALVSAPAHAVQVLPGEQGALSGALSTARNYVRHHLRRLIPDRDARSVLLALTLGERHHLDDALRERFVQTGLMHLLAVSGLHVLLVGMVLYQLLRPLLLRLGWTWGWMECVRSGATLGLLMGYLLLTGAPPSVVRAVVMTGLVLGSVLLQRKTHALNLLGAAAVVLLLGRPGHLFEPGFQLSFAAVGALVLLSPVMKDLLPEACFRGPIARYLSESLVASTAATLGTLPVLLFHFGHASFAGLMLNVVAIPLTMLGLGLTLLALLLAGVLPAVAALPAAAADVLIRTLLGGATAGAEWFGWFSLHRYLVDGWMVLALTLILFALVALPYPRRRWLLVAGALLATTIGLWIQVRAGAFEPRLEIMFLDVGQGDAALVTTPGGRQLLIDAGPRSPYVDHGERTVLPHLRRYGIRQLDAVVVTHADSDHLGGLPTLLRHVRVRRVLHNGVSHDSGLYRETMTLLDSLQVPQRALQAGDTLLLDPEVRLHVLAPDTTMLHTSNEASIVLRIAYGETCILMTGDVEARSEALLTSRYGAMLACEVVKVPHHGSRTSSTRAFVNAAAPDNQTPPLAVVSVGRRNIFRLPAPDILRRWHEARARVLSTAEEGAIWLSSDGHHVEHREW